MKELLDINSPKYLRRLVREINLSLLAGRSVYAKSYPCDVKVVKVVGGYNIKKVIVTKTDYSTESFGVDSFYDDSGPIVASKE